MCYNLQPGWVLVVISKVGNAINKVVHERYHFTTSCAAVFF